MKASRWWVFSLVASLAASNGWAQGITASLIDLGSNTVLSRFIVGRDIQAVTWAGNGVAYFVVEKDNTIVRMDMTVLPPAITAVYDLPAAFVPHNIKVNPAGTRALVTGESADILYLDLTTTPFPLIEAIPVIESPNGIAFYSGGNAAVVVDETQLLFLDLTNSPITMTSLGFPLDSIGDPRDGLDVAVNAAGTRAAVSLDMGGFLLVDLTTGPPTFMGPPIGPYPADALGIAVSPDGTRAIYVDESQPAPAAIVVDISGTPVVTDTIPIPLELDAPSAVAFNPVSGAAMISSDHGVAVLDPPYTSITTTILDNPSYSGTTAHALAVNPAGTRAINLNEDRPVTFISIDDVSVVEGGDATTVAAVFTLTLTHPAAQDIHLDYQTMDSTATLADNDYVLASGTLTIPPNTLSAQITVTVNGDEINEPDEVFKLKLSNADIAAFTDDEGHGTILNDDDTIPPSVHVVVPNGGEMYMIGDVVDMAWTATDNIAVSTIDLFLSRNGVGGPYEEIALGEPNDGTYPWTATGPMTMHAILKVVAHDAASNSIEDVSDGEWTIDNAVPTQLSMFVAEPAAGGIGLRWQFVDPGAFTASWAERAPGPAGPWSKVEAEARMQGGITTVVDGSVEPGRAYDYRLVARRATGGDAIFGPVTATAAAEVRDVSLAVAPNPTTGPARIDYALPREAHVRLTIVDLQGRTVATLLNGVQPAGRHRLDWAGQGANGGVAPGLYFVRFETAARSLVKRMLVAR